MCWEFPRTEKDRDGGYEVSDYDKAAGDEPLWSRADQYRDVVGGVVLHDADITEETSLHHILQMLTPPCHSKHGCAIEISVLYGREHSWWGTFRTGDVTDTGNIIWTTMAVRVLIFDT